MSKSLALDLRAPWHRLVECGSVYCSNHELNASPALSRHQRFHVVLRRPPDCEQGAPPGIPQDALESALLSLHYRLWMALVGSRSGQCPTPGYDALPPPSPNPPQYMRSLPGDSAAVVILTPPQSHRSPPQQSGASRTASHRIRRAECRCGWSWGKGWEDIWDPSCNRRHIAGRSAS